MAASSTRSRKKRRKSSARRASPPSILRNLSNALVEHLGGQSRDLLGISLFLAAVLCGLGIYVDVIGPAGDGIRAAGEVVFGWCRFLVPLVLGVAGVLVLHDPEETGLGRAAIGLVLLAVSVIGLAHLLGGAPDLGATRPELADAGGYLGVALIGPLHALLGPWGAGLIVGTIAAMGLLVLTQM